MKLACFGDLHGHNFKEFDTKTDRTGSRRLNNIVDTVAYIREYCKENEIKYVLVSGDIFQTRGKVDTLPYNAIYDEFKKFYKDGIILIVTVGNHDQKDNSDIPQHSLHAFNDLPGVYVYGEVGMHRICECNEVVDIVCVPYNKNAQSIKDYIQAVSVSESSTSRILLFHLGVSGATVGTRSYPMADAFGIADLKPDSFKYLVGGHYHQKQFLDGLPHAFYCGAPIQHSFNDEGEDKGFFVIDTDKRWDVQFVPIPNPKFYTIFSDQIRKLSAQELKRHADNGDYLRFQVDEDEVQFIKNNVPQELNYKIELQREYKEESTSDVKIGMSFEEIISKYADEHNPEAKEVGLKILQEVEEA